MAYQSFKELKVWKEAKDLTVIIYKITSNGYFKNDFGLRNQMRRASLSIASNIAEGYERNSTKEFIRFLLISKGSISELRTQIEISKEINYINQEIFDNIENKCCKIGSMITNLIKARKLKI